MIRRIGRLGVGAALAGSAVFGNHVWQQTHGSSSTSSTKATNSSVQSQQRPSVVPPLPSLHMRGRDVDDIRTIDFKPEYPNKRRWHDGGSDL